MVAPLDQFIAVEVLDVNVHSGAVADRALSHSRPIVVTPDQFAVEELNTKDPVGSVADHAATKYHADVVSLDKFIAANKVLDEKVPDGVGNGYALAQSHLVVVASADQSIAVKILDETASTQGPVIVVATPVVPLDEAALHGAMTHPIVVTNDQPIAVWALDETASGGGLAVDSDELLGGPFDSNHDARVLLRKTEPLDDGADPTVQFSHDTKRSLQVLKGTDTTKRSMQVLRGTVKRSMQDATTTCTLLASYNTDQSVDEVCKLTETLKSILPDAEPDASAIDVAKCRSRPGFICPPTRVSGSRRLISWSHAPFDALRSLHDEATPPPTSTPSPGYMVFTATAVDRNCTEIAAALMNIKGVYNVSVDIEGTTTTGRVSDNFIICQITEKKLTTSHLNSYSTFELAVFLQIKSSPPLHSVD